MWAKISGSFRRPETPLQEHFDIDDRPPTVLSAVFEQHPNLSNFHDPAEVPFPSPSPPASPSKHGRRGIFRRKGLGEHDQGSLSIKIPIPALKKVKSSINGSTSASKFSPTYLSLLGLGGAAPRTEGEGRYRRKCCSSGCAFI